jgi:hypothetical protein
MPRGGFYFDIIVRQAPVQESKLKVEDNVEECSLISDAELEHFKLESEGLYTETDKAIILNLGGLALGNIARV